MLFVLFLKSNQTIQFSLHCRFSRPLQIEIELVCLNALLTSLMLPSSLQIIDGV